jgi:ankyrin repeat protein
MNQNAYILHDAINGINSEELLFNLLIQNRDDVRKKDANGNYPLNCACQYPQYNKFSLHLYKAFKDASIFSSWANQHNIVHVALQEEEYGTAYEIIQRAQHLLNLFDDEGRGMTPIQQLFSDGLWNEQVKDFVSHLSIIVKDKVTFNMRSRIDGCTALHYACLNFMHEAIHHLLQLRHIDVTVIDNDGNPPFLYLIEDKSDLSLAIFNATNDGFSENIKCIDMFLDANPEVILQTNICGQNALHLSCYCGHYNVFKYFFKMLRSEINSVDDLGNTPLHLAISKDRSDIVEFMLHQKDVLLNKKNKDGLTSFHMACKCNSNECLKILLWRKDIDRATKDFYGNTILHAAVSGTIDSSHVRCFTVTYLLQSIDCIDTDDVNYNGKTAKDVAEEELNTANNHDGSIISRNDYIENCNEVIKRLTTPIFENETLWYR